MGLGQFNTDGATANNDQVVRRLSAVENGLVGQIRHSLDAGDRRHHGAAAGGDHETPGTDYNAAGLDPVGRREAGGSLIT